jgi:hypothetical protein
VQSTPSIRKPCGIDPARWSPGARCLDSWRRKGESNEAGVARGTAAAAAAGITAKEVLSLGRPGSEEGGGGSAGIIWYMGGSSPSRVVERAPVSSLASYPGGDRLVGIGSQHLLSNLAALHAL